MKLRVFVLICLSLISFRAYSQENCLNDGGKSVIHIICPSSAEVEESSRASKQSHSSVVQNQNYPVKGPGAGGLNGLVPIRSNWSNSDLPWRYTDQVIIKGDSLFIIYTPNIVYLLKENENPEIFLEAPMRSVLYDGKDSFCYHNYDLTGLECKRIDGLFYQIEYPGKVKYPAFRVGEYFLQGDSAGVFVFKRNGDFIIKADQVWYDYSGNILVDTSSGEAYSLFWLKNDSLYELSIAGSPVEAYAIRFGVNFMPQWIFKDNTRMFFFDRDDNVIKESIYISTAIYVDENYIIAIDETDNVLYVYNQNSGALVDILEFNEGFGRNYYVAKYNGNEYIISGIFNSVRINNQTYKSAFGVIKYNPSNASISVVGKPYSGFNGEVMDLTVINELGILCAGGNFTMVGGRYLPYVACTQDPELKAENWFGLQENLNDFVSVLKSDGAGLWAAGMFSSENGKYIARYDFDADQWEWYFNPPPSSTGGIIFDYFIGVPFTDIYIRNDTAWIVGQYAIRNGDEIIDQNVACEKTGCWQPYVIPKPDNVMISSQGAPQKVVATTEELIYLLSEDWGSRPFFTESGRLAENKIEGLVFEPLNDSLFWNPIALLDTNAYPVMHYPHTKNNSIADVYRPIDAVKTPYGWLWGDHRVFVQTDSTIVDVGYSIRGEIRSVAFFKDHFIIAGNIQTVDSQGNPQLFIYSVPANQIVFPSQRPKIVEAYRENEEYHLLVKAPDSTHHWVITVDYGMSQPTFYYNNETPLQDHQCISENGYCSVKLSVFDYEQNDTLWVSAFLPRPGPTGYEGSLIYGFQLTSQIPVTTKNENLFRSLTYQLGPLYPNPLLQNNQLLIQYAIPNYENVKFVIYNVLGQEIARIDQGVQTPGIHQVYWNGTDSSGKSVSPGIYFIQMKTSSKQLVTKVIVM